MFDNFKRVGFTELSLKRKVLYCFGYRFYRQKTKRDMFGDIINIMALRHSITEHIAYDYGVSGKQITVRKPPRYISPGSEEIQ